MDVEVLTFSGFSSQLLKIAFITTMIIAYLISKIRSSIYVTFQISLNFINWLDDKPLFDERKFMSNKLFFAAVAEGTRTDVSGYE